MRARLKGCCVVIDDILTAAGVQYRRARFPRPPAGTYAVYLDDISSDGADDVVCLYTHEATVELYEPAPDDAAELAIEAQLISRGIPWTKQDRYWLQDEQMYQVAYDFTYYEKRRIK